MKRLIMTSVAAACAGLALVACGDRDRDVTGAATAPTTRSIPATTPTTGAGATGAASPTTAAPGTATGSTGPSAAPAMAAADLDFVMTAASSDLMEVEASRLAVERTRSDAVRKFAQQMVDDHTKMSQQLASIAREGGLTGPMQMNPAHSGDLDRLHGLDGRDFDREYAAQVGVAVHQLAITLFERASREVSNPQLKSLAEQTLPHLRDHLKQSQVLAKQVGVPGERLKLANAAGAPGGTGSTAAPASGSLSPGNSTKTGQGG